MWPTTCKTYENLAIDEKKKIYKNIKDKSVALAVSGGSDSLCLAYFTKV